MTRLLAFLIGASVGLALVQATAKLAMLLLLGFVLLALIQRPIEMTGCFCGLLLLGLIGRFPPLAALLLAAIALAKCLRSDSRFTAESVSPGSAEGLQNREHDQL